MELGWRYFVADEKQRYNVLIQARKLTPGIGNYSTSEVDTGFTWIDGSSIFKKTVNFGALPNNTSKFVDVSMPTVFTVIKVEAVATNSSGSAHMIDGIYGSASDNVIFENLFFQVDSGAMRIACSTSRDRSSFNGYVTIYYIKSS